MKSLRIAVLIFAFVPFALSVQVTGDQVIERYIHAIGGRAAVSGVGTLMVKATYMFESSGERYDALFYWKKPRYVRAEFLRKQREIMGFDGARAWTAKADRDTGRVFTSNYVPEASPLAARFLRLGGLESLLGGPPLQCRALGVAIRLMPPAEEDVKDLAQIRLTWSDGYEKDYYFSASSGLLVREVEKDQRGNTHSSTYSDYRAVAGIQIAFERNNRGPGPPDGREVTIHQNIVDLQINLPLPEALFTKP